MQLEELLEMAHAIVASVTDAPSAPGEAMGTMDLTAREREVLQLVAHGLSDKEIAVELGIARYTASNHVASIRVKLGISSRAALAALAVRDGLA